jgi:hypothetical protein
MPTAAMAEERNLNEASMARYKAILQSAVIENM